MSIQCFLSLLTENLGFYAVICFSGFENFKIMESIKFRYFAPNPRNKTIPLFGPSTVSYGLYVIIASTCLNILLSSGYRKYEF